jgi:hypothetical protein
MKKTTKKAPSKSVRQRASNETRATIQAAETPTKKELARLVQDERVDAAIKKGEAASPKLYKRLQPEVLPEPQPVAHPSTPLTKAIQRAGFKYQRSEVVDARTTAHGYVRARDGAAAVFSHDNTSPGIAPRWVVKLKNEAQTQYTGKTLPEFAAAMVDARSGVLATPAAAAGAVRLLHELTAGRFDLSALTGDGNYTARVQLLKKLRSTDKVLAKTTGINQLVKEFYAALSTPEGTIAARGAAFSAQCKALMDDAAKRQRAIKTASKTVAADVRSHEVKQPILDGKVPTPAPKPLTRKQRLEAAAELRAEIGARVIDPEDAEDPSIPDPKRPVNFDVDAARAVELPNGVVCLQLEAENSQGAVAVSDNGTCVSACMLSTNTLKLAKPVKGPVMLVDLAKRMLEPLNKRVIVKPAAAYHLRVFLAQMDLVQLRAEAEAPAIKPPAKYARTLQEIDLRDVVILENPKNGDTFLRVEKVSSQGAICVYNNSSQVASGVVPPEILNTLRPVIVQDFLRDVNQLLHPITDAVVVTPTAERYLTAVLDACKENIEMAEKTRKFTPPAAAAKKTATTKPAAKKVAKADGAGRTHFTDEQVITVVAKENPYNEGSKAAATFALFAKAKTVGKFKELAAADKAKYEAGYLRYASRDGHIKVK